MSNEYGITPGPWEQGIGGDSAEVYAGKCTPENPRIRVCMCQSFYVPHSTNIANARAIAEVPAMLEVLELATKKYDIEAITKIRPMEVIEQLHDMSQAILDRIKGE